MLRCTMVSLFLFLIFLSFIFRSFLLAALPLSFILIAQGTDYIPTMVSLLSQVGNFGNCLLGFLHASLEGNGSRPFPTCPVTVASNLFSYGWPGCTFLSGGGKDICRTLMK